jgi:hypothetical protein
VFVSRAEFVRRGKDRGLLLVARAPEPPALPRYLVFDFRARRLVPREGWKSAPPARLEDWTVTPLRPKPDEPNAFAVGRAGRAKTLVRLEKDQVPTAHALLPPCPPLNKPLLAVAFVEGGVASIGLYDASSGRQARRYTGHVGPIGSLAFDADGRLLVSAAEDKTVCVWALTDLGQTLGQRGMLRGLPVKQGRDGLLVAQLDKRSLSAGNLAALKGKGVVPDDLLEGLVGDKGLRKFGSPQAFYEALWQLRPDTTVSLQVRGRGRVPLKVDQGIDDHKPLFSLFLPELGGTRPWLAWSPSGPYDTGDRARGEGSMGWHRNPAKIGAPVEFSTADRYRKEYRREGILRFLVEKGNLPEALKAWKAEPVPPFGMRLRIKELDPDSPRCDQQNRLVLQGGPFTLTAEIDGAPLGKIDKVRWQIDGGAPRAFDEQESDTRLSADLSKLKWQRGPHELRLLVTTVDSAEHPESLLVHYLPLPPSVRFEPTWLEKQFGSAAPKNPTVTKAELEVEARAAPGANGPAGPRVKVSLRHNDNDPVQSPAGTLVVRRKVTLGPGDNVLEARADNVGASPDLPFESASARLVVRYNPPPKKKVEPPQITLESVQPDGAEAVSLPLPRGKDSIVHAPLVRIRGRISAEGPLTEATLNGKGLGGFKAGRKSPFPIDELVQLKPGANELKFSARAGAEAPVLRTLPLTYHPDLPRLDPTERRSLTRRAGEPLDFTVELRLTELTRPFDYRAYVRVNEGDKLEARVSKERLLTARVRLRPGPNRLRVVLKNKFWEHTEELSVYHQQPPVVLSLTAPPVSDKPFADLTAQVRTPKGLPLRGARLNGRELDEDALVPPSDREVWTVRVKGVPLQPGKNTLELTVRNDDGECLKPGTLTVLHKPPMERPKAPRVELLEPLRDNEVAEPRCVFAFQVHASAKARVNVLHNGKALAPGAPRAEDGARVYRLTVALLPGNNTLQAVVVDEGGPAETRAVVVSYPPPWTVRVHAERLERQDKAGAFFPLTAKAPFGNVRLHGHVEWRKADDPWLRRPVRLRVWVNDFEQFSAELGPARGLRRAFTANVRLNQEQNRTQLQLFPTDLKPAPDSALDLRLACARPEKDQRLHLVVLGPGRRDQKALTDRVLKAFLAQGVKDNRFHTPAFREARVYPQPGDITRQGLNGVLRGLKSRLRSTPGPLNDVVIVFFSGEEAVRGEKHYLLTAASRLPGRLEEASFDCDQVRDILSDFPGAKLLLLDVRRTPGPPPPRMDRDDYPHLGLYRYVWLGRSDAPEKARLVHALEQSLSQAALVQDQSRLLTAWAKGLGSDAWFALLCPPGLQRLQLGKMEK